MTDRVTLSPGTLMAPLPAVLVSCSCTDGDREITDIVTVAWTGIINSNPAMTYISLRPSRYSHGIIERSGCFVINLTSSDMSKKVDYCGTYTGAKVDKFVKCGFTAITSTMVSAPSIAECPLSLECVLEKPEGVDMNPLHLGTHDMFFARIAAVTADASLIDDKGRLRLEKAGLMNYVHGEYYAQGKYAGKFGFSARKKQ